MKFLVYSFNVFVLLLLIGITYNLSINVDNNPVDRSLRRYKRETTDCKNREEHLEKCNTTFTEKLGTYYTVTSIFQTSQYNGGGVCSTDYFYGLKKQSSEETGDCYLRYKSFNTSKSPICDIYSCNHVSEWNSTIFE